MADEVHSSPFPLERWLKLAESKLKNKYVLRVEAGRRNARFFKRGYGFEPCPFQAAQYLIQSGYVVAIKEDAREVTYELAPGVTHIEAGKAHSDDIDLDEEDVDYGSEDEETLDDSEFDEDELEESEEPEE